MYEFDIPDMTCGHCASMVGQALRLADPACQLKVDLQQRRVTVQSAEPEAALAEALVEAGYPPA